MAPLHYAAKYGRIDVARLLVENGADVYLAGDDGCLPIHFAVKYRPEVFVDGHHPRLASHRERAGSRV